MEALLSLAFDNLSSKNTDKVRTGLKQIEGLLAQICLSKATKLGHNRRASVITSSNSETPKTLRELPIDPAFREFFRLQESFEYNVATHLLATLNALLSRSPGTVDGHLSSTLAVLQGILLLHPPSRHLFIKQASMDTLLDLLDTANPPAVQQSAILVLVTALLNNPPAIRTFERVDGLLSIKDLLRSEETSKGVKMRVLEFLYFYLMPEAPSSSPPISHSRGTALRVKRSTSSLAEDDEDGGVSIVSSNGSYMAGGWGYDYDGERMEKTIKSTREKQRLLGQYLSNVDDLVEDLRESNLFG
ncbi:uncharacterized protein PV09_05015 [Verruconis gallopava]|uniref:Cell division control protein 14 n=1 Tax=Verruconis gallopava TaxID=253628 RepID=A0A0D1XMG9_9PEZI|nr:uncharacterized protein PV09_05015 [Verruconis gallopava]KIW03701.1 hypothetical protein PV09_05015 [Verruconis gallopava]